jgi:DNA-binding transcriptional MerR regulator
MGEDRPRTAGEVCRIADISYRQLDDWCRTGLVPLPDPMPGYGRRRQFDQAAVDRVVEIAEARRRVASLRQVAS